jgi:hypothetical protein
MSGCRVTGSGAPSGPAGGWAEAAGGSRPEREDGPPLGPLPSAGPGDTGSAALAAGPESALAAGAAAARAAQAWKMAHDGKSPERQ